MMAPFLAAVLSLLPCATCLATLAAPGWTHRPLLAQSTVRRHASALLAAGAEEPAEEPGSAGSSSNPLLLAAGAAVVLSVAAHAPAFATFASQWSAIGAAGVHGEEFWSAFRFWAFFAIGHVLIKPAVWIGEVLHTSPGPLVGVFPLSFLAANAIVLGLLAIQPKIRSAVSVLAIASAINFVGSGLDGTVNNADYNLALDDGVKGCPAYEQVRMPSMDGFDISKYDGRWYEHAFHDWTQFSEVYDTTFDIQLSGDGTRWLDDFGVRGPSPTAAPASWDKSPVANGAHYFLTAKYDKSTPGVVMESGFGATFPNYIIDVQRGPNGEYTEALQFQCFQRGGVRIFEGINYLTRSPQQSPEQLAAMHARAAAAGISPYGANPQQTHVVEFAPSRGDNHDNDWQRLWGAIGVDKLLALLETSTHTQFEQGE